MAVSVTFTQDAFRGRNDDGTEATATWIADENTDWNQVIGETFRIRFLVSRLNEGSSQNGSMDLYVSKNAGAYVHVESTAGTSPAQDVASSTLDAQGTNTTQQIGVSTYLTANKGVNNNSGFASTDSTTWPSGTAYEAEMEFSIYLVPSLVEVGDTFDFRVRFNDTVFSGGYTFTPHITANRIRYVRLKGGTLALKGGTLTIK